MVKWGGEIMREYKSAFRALRSRRAVFKAMAEWDALGQDAFLRLYGFEPADSYVLRHAGKAYASKAIVGVAFGLQYPEKGVPPAGAFSSGKGHASGFLARLGFQVDGVPPPRPSDWTLDEVEAAVTGFFTHYARTDRHGRAAQLELVTALKVQIPTRSEKSIRDKLSNINAVLDELGLTPVDKIGKLSNSQILLQAIVRDWIDEHFERFDMPAPPTSSSRPLEVEPPSATMVRAVAAGRMGCRVDFAARDERNRALGLKGEEWACNILRQELRDAGRADLAERVVWTSKDEGDGLGFDIRSFTPSGDPIVVEVKTTNGGIAAPFFLSPNELAASARYGAAYLLLRLFDFSGTPRFYRTWGDLSESCQLEAAGYRAIPNTNRQ